ncbi:MAG: hypothetical protein H7144_07680 [Burkholderiales bacterium]|nr:hypothetical protein [Phycisphaerae bacterium]
MTPRFRAAAFSTLILCGLTPALSPAAVPPEQADLAERLLQTGAALAQDGNTFSVAVPLSEAALRLVGDDPRLLRLAIDLQLRLGNRDKAIELLAGLRKADPGDELAQVQTIDLNVDRMQSADAKETYLKQVMAAEAVPGAIRSHAAVMLVSVLKERRREDEIGPTLEQALKLNPVNPKALQWVVESVFASGAPAPKRAEAIVNLLRSNPMQPALISNLAEELARAGLTDDALTMYRRAFDLETAMQIPAPANDAINASALLLISPSRNEAPAAAAAATQLEPSSSRAWFMRLLVERHIGDGRGQEATLTDARTALTRNLMALHRAIDPSAPEVKEDTAPQLPDVRADAQEIVKGNNGDLARAYAGSLADLGWLDAYFAARAPDPAVIAALETLTGQNSPVVTRLQGFAALTSGQDDEANVKLSAIAQSDPLARVGMLALRVKKGEPKDALLREAAQLLSEIPVDVWSTTLRYTLKDLGNIGFRTPDADALRAEVQKLPDDWLQLARAPGQFYVMKLTPMRVGVTPGEPMFLTLQFQNISKHPLVIGPGGVIDQQVVMDASVKGAVEQYVPAVGIARLSGKLVLQPRQSTTALVRIDSGELSAFLNTMPHLSLSVYASAVTNARSGPNSTVIPGPGGMREQSDSVFNRQATSFMKDTGRAGLVEQLKSGDPIRRLLALRALSANATAMRGSKDAPPELLQLASGAEDMMRQSLDRETVPAVRAQGLQLLMGMQKDANQTSIMLQNLVISPDWESRAVGALVAIGIPQESRKQFLAPLASDTDEVIKRLAEAVMAVPDPVPATQPADGASTPAPTTP